MNLSFIRVKRRRSSEPSPLSSQIQKKYREHSDHSTPDSSIDYIMSQTFASPTQMIGHPTNQAPNSQVAFGPGMLPPQLASTPLSQAAQLSQPPPMPAAMLQQSSIISDYDIQRLASAVRQMMATEIKDMIKDEIRQLIVVNIAPMHATIETLAAKNKELEMRVDELEAYSRKNLIRISGVSEDEKDTNVAVTQIAEKLEIPVAQADIEVSHRVGPIDPKRPRQIIARIKNYELRHRLLRSSKKLKDIPGMSNVHINQDLSKARGKLAYHARQLVREKKIKSTFVWDGRVIAVDLKDKKHTIQCVDDLIKIVGALGTGTNSLSPQSPQVLTTHPDQMVFST
ncbi:hypothetical protein FSP39_014950 [Pinctada imbricata]|uniref:Uncharacterized protein n=1 Tax=Pinctada imbricata TaxID=66713 RepID=A0AA88XZ00_PINIB|nr:hypothetical protein FSP39_014950 [Pinctada imbricata]